jgi:glycosyltransferase involved in cell wall biosynthesis
VYYSVLEGAPGEREAIRAADLVLANSAGMRRYLARKGVQAEDGAGGVNVGWFRPPAPDPRTARARERGAPVRALVFGRLSRKRKGTWIAACAVERASMATGVPVEVTLFDSPPGGETPSLPRPLRVPHRWTLHPSQRELADLYGTSDLFVSAERRAGWCNTAAEAMACGTPVVCTRSGTEDFAIEGVTASVARWRWSWSLERAIQPLLRDPGRRALLAAAGVAKIQEFSWDKTADRIERALEKRMGGRLHGEHAARAAR